MSIKIECKKHGMWAYEIYAGEDGDMDEFAASGYEYETEHDCECAALRWIMDEWHIYE